MPATTPLTSMDFRDILDAPDILTAAQAAERPAAISDNSSCTALGILRPRTTEQLSQILQRCNAAAQPVIVQGGKTGGAISTAAEWIISMECMNRIETIDRENRVAIVEGGCLLQNLQDAAAQAGFHYGVDYGGRGSATIGGNIATNAGGNNVIRYGMTRDQILGLEVVLADGTVIDNMSRVIKDNAGYDLKHLFIGSEGTLGVVTRAVIRLRPRMATQNMALLAMHSFDQVKHLLAHCEQQFADTLTAFEVMWNGFYAGASADAGRPLAADFNFYVIVDVQGSAPEHDTQHFDCTLEQAILDNLCDDAVIAKSETQRHAIWNIRDNVQWILQRPAYYPFDISLPIAQMHDYVDTLQTALVENWPGAELIVFGHIGDGNLHVFVTTPAPLSPDAHAQLSDLIYAPLTACRGSIAAEHGVGTRKSPYLHYCRTPAELLLMQRIKHALDPHNILGRGRVVAASLPS